MEYLQLGNSEIKVSRLCLGCMSFGDPASKMHAWTLNPDQSETIIKHALDLGINFIDTANTYSAGTSEEYLGRAIKKKYRSRQSHIGNKSLF
nr:aldo/keto reductase [Gilliamella bombi]